MSSKSIIIQNIIDTPIKYNNAHDLWTDKYKPATIQDIVTVDSIKNKLNILVSNNDPNNTIITGPSGVGKTAIITCLTKTLLKNNHDTDSLYLNSTNDHGMKQLQDKLINFCKKNRSDNTKYKILVLDEIDNMNSKIQQIVVGLMESFKDSLRVLMSCNTTSEIAESIQSRSVIIRVPKLEELLLISRLKYICSQENITYTDESLKDIFIISDGDLRKSINSLQLISTTYNKNITTDNIYSLCDRPNPRVLKNIILTCMKKDIKNSLILLKDLQNKGYSSSDIILNTLFTLRSDIISDTEISEENRIKCMGLANQTCLNIKGVDTDIQLTGFIAAMCRI